MLLVEIQMMADTQFDKQHDAHIRLSDLVLLCSPNALFSCRFYIMFAVLPHVIKLSIRFWEAECRFICYDQAWNFMCSNSKIWAFLLAFSGDFGEVSGEVFQAILHRLSKAPVNRRLFPEVPLPGRGIRRQPRSTACPHWPSMCTWWRRPTLRGPAPGFPASASRWPRTPRPPCWTATS